MPHKTLKNKPLVEAMLECRWQLTASAIGHETDPNFQLLLGRFYDRMQTTYPEYEQLPTAGIPDGLVSHVVQHRFRSGPNQWPLVQIGPGILTVNSTADYTWEAFRPRAVEAVAKLFESHPKPEQLKITHLILRYIDAIAFDYQAEHVLRFLKDKMKIDASFPKSLFGDNQVEEKPIQFNWQTAFKCEKPLGIVAIQFGLGQKENMPAIIWDTSVQSAAADIPAIPTEFDKWISQSHEVASDWFFKLIEGDLERKFSGE